MALCTLDGPGIGGRSFVSLLWCRSGPSFVSTCSTILAVSESDSSSAANLGCVAFLLDRCLLVSFPSTASRDCAILFTSSIHLAALVAAWARSS